jgi:flagellar biosynthesis/type III secretory pathway chaperone
MSRRNANPGMLRRLLQEEYLLCKRLLALAEQQTDALVTHNVQELTRLQGEQERCIAQQGTLEKTRTTVVRDLAWAAGLERVPTLKNLLPSLPPREQPPLEQLRLQLLEIHADLQKVHARNRHLLENALHYVRFSLDVLTSAVLKPARYGTNLTRVSSPAFYIDSKA